MAKPDRHPASLSKDELIEEVIKLRHILGKITGTGTMVEMESGVSMEGKPFVHYRWGAESSQWTCEETKQHGLKLIETAMAAESDAAVFAVMVAVGGATAGDAAQILIAMREHRGGNREKSA